MARPKKNSSPSLDVHAVAEVVVQTVLVELHRAEVALPLSTMSAVIGAVEKKVAELSAARAETSNP